ncbi:hypothetical protein AGMMS49975_08860 [Clostridia bacterium]|nr:hypothetical protein AGMMS49975_08860 [Clostridia bacterium]
MDSLIDFYAQMLADLPSQFRGKERIEGLIHALSRQLNYVSKFYRQLDEERALKAAVGKQLDGIGEIVVMSREQATVLALKSLEFTEMTDDIYRLYLLQKMLANMTICTYVEIYQAMVILWGKTPIWYSEDPNEPATITLTIPALPSYDMASTFLGVWEIRPAGVQLHFTASASESIGIHAAFAVRAFLVTHDRTGTKPRDAVLLNIDGIIIDEKLSREMFTAKHEQTRETLHSGTNPVRIIKLDIDGVNIKEDISKAAVYTETHDRAGTKPHEAVPMCFQGIVIDEQGQTSKWTVEPPQTSENLHTGTEPYKVMVLGEDSVEIHENVAKSAFTEVFDRAGTKPNEAVVAAIEGISIKGSGETSKVVVNHDQTSPDLHSGTNPSEVLLQSGKTANVYEVLSKEVYGIEYERSGTEPQPSVFGETDAAGIKTSIAPAEYSVKYKKCGRGVTKS